MIVDAPEEHWRPRADRLVNELTVAGHLGPRWRWVLAAVPRHRFVPRFWRLDRYNRPSVLIDPAADPQLESEWLDGAYADRPLVTAWSPSMMGAREVRLVTSSASQPSVVATMLDRLDLRPGQRVLEIGTGSGYNAALLCEYLGDGELVASIEIDPDLAQLARQALHAGGYRPTIIVGNGSRARDVTGPFDRIIATCAVDRVPDAWIEWLAPGGRLVTPSSLGNSLLVLDKVGDSRLEGHVDGFQVAFMSLRSKPHVDSEDGSAFVIGSAGERVQLTTTVNPAVLQDASFQYWLATTHPRVRLAFGEHQHDGLSMVYTVDHSATVNHTRHECGWVAVQDEGRLWSAVESAWATFDAAGRPGRDAMECSVTIGGRTEYRVDMARLRNAGAG